MEPCGRCYPYWAEAYYRHRLLPGWKQLVLKSNTTYLNYTLGKLMIQKLRDDWQAEQGASYNLKAFHDELLSHGGPPKITQPAVCLLRAAITDHVSPLVSEVHHPDPKLEKYSQVPKFIGYGLPLLHKGNPVSGQVKAVPALLLGCHNIVVYCGI